MRNPINRDAESADIEVALGGAPPNPPMISGSISSGDVTNNRPTSWTTSCFDCCADEETCWWGFWCSCLLQARTADTFDVSMSKMTLLSYFFVTCTWIFCFIFGGFQLGVCAFILISGYLAYTRGEMRNNIRERLGYINPSYLCIPNDYILHFFSCCAPCAICQEAREAKVYGLRSLDFCTGQPLVELREAHERAIGRQADSVSDILIPSNGDLASHIAALSQLSKVCIILSSTALLLVLIFFVVSGDVQQAAIFLLIFVQPAALLYWFYWRDRRQYASLDMVLKMFFVGFWVCVVQAAAIEAILEVALAMLLFSFFGIDLSKFQSALEDDDNTRQHYDSDVDNPMLNAIRCFSKSLRLIHPDSRNILVTMYANGEGREGVESQAGENPADIMKDHMVQTVIILFLLSFGIAAAVEETVKHFAVRNCLRYVSFSQHLMMTLNPVQLKQNRYPYF